MLSNWLSKLPSKLLSKLSQVWRSRSTDDFRILLHLEWLLLGLALITSVLPGAPFQVSLSQVMLAGLGITALGLMGLWLPSRRLHQGLYTAAEIFVILLLIRLYPVPHAVPFLLMVVVVRSYQMFRRQGRMVTIAIAGSLFVLQLLRLDPSQRPRCDEIMPTNEAAVLNITVSFGMLVAAVLMMVNSLLTERQSREKLAIAYEQLHQYALRIEDQATLQERNRIARDIHDSLGHVLTAQSIQLENALLFCPPGAPKTRGFLASAQQLCSSALHDVRESVAKLRAHPLQGRSLESALTNTLSTFQQTTGITLQSDLRLLHSQPLDISTAVYRVLQEALTNIHKHSAATQVTVQLVETSDTLKLRIEDNGRGFLPQQNTTGFGLQGMRERVVELGGQFEILSQPGAGCVVAADIPLQEGFKS